MTGGERQIRVCIVEDHWLVRDSLANLISAQPDMEVVLRCGSVEETLRTVDTQGTDLILLDLYLGADTGFALLDQLPKTGFDGRVLVVAGVVSDQEAFRIACQGVAGIVLKTASPEMLLEAIRRVSAGEVWYDPAILKKILEQTAHLARESQAEEFTPREKVVMRHILNGLSNKEIAARMDLRESSVKSVIQILFDKSGVRSRAQLVRVALERMRGEL